MMNHIKEGLLEFSKFYRGPARSETRKPQKRGKRSEMLENTRKPLKHSETKITKTRKHSNTKTKITLLPHIRAHALVHVAEA